MKHDVTHDRQSKDDCTFPPLIPTTTVLKTSNLRSNLRRHGGCCTLRAAAAAEVSAVASQQLTVELLPLAGVESCYLADLW